MVYRLYVEKKTEYALEAQALLRDAADFLRIGSLKAVRLLNRYDVEGIGKSLFDRCRTAVFSEPQVDDAYDCLPTAANGGAECRVFAVEPLPGQYDQRSDSAAQCVQMLSQGERPALKQARVYMLFGDLSDADFAAVKKHVINPVESREASLKLPDTLRADYEPPAPVAVLRGFCALTDNALKAFRAEYGLAMDEADLRCCRGYFACEGRVPTLAEIRVLDTYWSDHCRHTTFFTVLDDIEFESSVVRAAYQRYLGIRAELEREGTPVTLMDIATIGAKYLKRQGLLQKLDESEENNACSVRVEADVDGKPEPWLLMFKNETHNHPTEIEPFGGAATCIGGAIRDPLSGRAYVYQAVRISGAGNPLAAAEETLAGKLPQRKIATAAAAGYSSYGNQIGLATGFVREIYHPGYVAKRLELGAVAGAAPAGHVVRRKPEAGDVVVLLGGRTGRDGCGGATGSSKPHTASSLERCGSEVQKGNAPEERKLQRLFRNGEATRLIKRCNDFGAGGVSVAIGELARGLEIDLDRVPKKYEGLDGTELAISESQERMAAVVAAEDAARFMAYAAEENLEATPVARVTGDARLRMKHKGEFIVDLARDFLDTNGAEKRQRVRQTGRGGDNALFTAPERPAASLQERFEALVCDLNVCSQKGLADRFDSTVGAGTVLLPFGGTYQMTPAQATAMLLPVLHGETGTASIMAYGYDPFLTEQDPYAGAYLAVAESVAKVIASGGTRRECYLSLQEYFEKLETAPEKWGQPVAALLGALDAQLALGVAAIGGKDSMSGSFERLHVPPTLVSFAVSVAEAENIASPEFKRERSRVVLLAPRAQPNGLPEPESLAGCFDETERLIRGKQALSAYAVGMGGVAEAVFKMCLGNRLGFRFADGTATNSLFAKRYGAFVLELADGAGIPAGAAHLGDTAGEYRLQAVGESLDLRALQRRYESVLQSVYPYAADDEAEKAPAHLPPVGTLPESQTPRADPGIPEPVDDRIPERIYVLKGVKPQAFVPVFPGTNCEYDTARALSRAGVEPKQLVVRNLTKEAVSESIERAEALLNEAQMLIIPGGFSGGDEPDGSGKFITAFFRSPRLSDAVSALLDQRGGLILGICNGFQALIKLGLIPFGKIVEPDAAAPTLTFNAIGRHQSLLVRTKIVSVRSPWFAACREGDIHAIPVSHGEGRFAASVSLMRQLVRNGQLAAQYVDLDGNATMDARYNPNGSLYAAEAITSPDGRVLGKMGHSERQGRHTYKNVPGCHDQRLFESAAAYFALPVRSAGNVRVCKANSRRIVECC